MRFVRYKSFEDIPLSRTKWDELVSRSDGHTVFQRYFWTRKWWQHFGDNFELYFVAAMEEDTVVGFAALMIDKDGVLRFIADSNSDYLSFIFPENHAASVEGLFSFLKNNSSDWRVIHLRNIRRREDIVDPQISARAVGLAPWNNYSVAAPYLRISDNDQELNKLMSKYSFRRAERYLQAQGDLSFRDLSSQQDAESYWTTFAQQHLSRCEAVGRTSSFEDSRYLPFLRSLLDDPDSFVSFSGLFLRGQPIAFHYGFEFNGVLIWYKPSIDVSIARGSPGVSLILHLIRDARSRNVRELDFTIGDEPFKNRFCSESRMVDEFRIHKTRLSCIIETGYWQIRRAVKRWVQGADSPSIKS
jgi:CelD/BcsL family acetyltransferase involved in cellulose biosynthesis